MAEKLFDDYKFIGALPHGSTEKRRAFLILKKVMNDDSSQEDWDRAARILCDIKITVSSSYLEKSCDGFEELLKKATEHVPSIIPILRDDVLRKKLIKTEKKKWVKIKEIVKTEEELAEEEEDRKNLEEYYRIMGKPKKGKK